MNIIICPGFRASTAPLVCLLYNTGQTYLLRVRRVRKGTTSAAKIRTRQTLKTRLARETSMRPAATRPAWRHERVELERVVDCKGGSNAPPESPWLRAWDVIVKRSPCNRKALLCSTFCHQGNSCTNCSKMAVPAVSIATKNANKPHRSCRRDNTHVRAIYCH